MPLLKEGIVPCLTQRVIDRLRKIKILSVSDFVVASQGVLEATGITVKEINTIKNVLISHYSAFPINGSDAVNEMISSHAILNSGCSGIDKLLDGGLYTNEITEICGSPASGKTQIALSATQYVGCIGRYSVLYIDTAGGFNVSRLIEISHAKGASASMIKEFEGNVKHCFVTNVFNMFTLLESTINNIKMQKDHFHRKLKLIVVDSINFIFSPFLGGTQTDVCGLMVQLAYQLKVLSVECKLAILITNSVVQGDGGIVKLALGTYWHHVSNTQLVIEMPSFHKNKASAFNSSPCVRKVIVFKSTKKAKGEEVIIKITSKGVENEK